MKAPTVDQRTTRPILFSGEMVRAILEGRKTQTRRVVKPQPASTTERVANIALMPPRADGTATELHWMPQFRPLPRCPYGKPGDHLWVRESAVITRPYSPDHTGPWATFKDGSQIDNAGKQWQPDAPLTHEWWKAQGHKLTPAIHVPRWASRISLVIAAVHVERIQDISEADAKAEGAPNDHARHWPNDDPGTMGDTYRRNFCFRWNDLNAKRGFGWDANPWVWVIQFQVVKVPA